MEAGYRIINILLLESTFKRGINIALPEGVEEIPKNIEIDLNVSVDDSKLFVTETLKFSQMSDGTEEVQAEIKMVGIFEIIGQPNILPEQFGKVNGAAIIFPFVREHLATLSAKAGVGLVLLPPINFTKIPQKEPQKQ